MTSRQQTNLDICIPNGVHRDMHEVFIDLNSDVLTEQLHYIEFEPDTKTTPRATNIDELIIPGDYPKSSKMVSDDLDPKQFQDRRMAAFFRQSRQNNIFVLIISQNYFILPKTLSFFTSLDHVTEKINFTFM